MSGRLPDLDVFEKLALVEGHRREFTTLLGRMVEELVEGLPSEGPVVEIGAGDGQFTALLEPLLGRRLIVTEPTETGSARLIARFPQLDVRRAAAEVLPVEEGSLAAIVGCCTLDVLPDLPRALEDMMNRLRPEGVLAHLLDMTTDLSGLMEAVIADRSILVVPNVWSTGGDDDWPEDLLLVHRSELERVAALADPEAAPLRALLSARTVTELMSAFEAVHGSAEGRHRFRQSFARARASAPETARAELERFSGQALSSGRLFAQRLEAATPEGLDVVQSELLICAEPAAGGRWRRSILGFVQAGRGPDDRPGERRLGAHVFRAVRQKRRLGDQPMSMSSSDELP